MIAFQLQNKKPSNLMPNANTVELWLKEGSRVSRITLLVCNGAILTDLFTETRLAGFRLTYSQFAKLDSAIANF